jgi:hypothetical protein
MGTHHPVEFPHVAPGGVHAQLIRLLAAARADGSADVVVACGAFAVELSFPDGRVVARTARDASSAGDELSLEDEAVLLILGWRRDDARSPFYREWHPNTTSADIAEDVLRTARHAYQCDSADLKVLVRVAEPAREVAAH